MKEEEGVINIDALDSEEDGCSGFRLGILAAEMLAFKASFVSLPPLWSSTFCSEREEEKGEEDEEDKAEGERG